jgi:hypothetical protein
LALDGRAVRLCGAAAELFDVEGCHTLGIEMQRELNTEFTESTERKKNTDESLHMPCADSVRR